MRILIMIISFRVQIECDIHLVLKNPDGIIIVIGEGLRSILIQRLFTSSVTKPSDLFPDN